MPCARERGEAVPPEMSAEVARRVKEEHCYICSDVAKEFAKHDSQRDKYVKLYTATHPKTGQPFSCDVGYERFLGPEVRLPSLDTPQPKSFVKGLV